MLRLRRSLSDLIDITECVAIVFGVLLALLVLLEIEEAQRLFAHITLGALAIRGFATIALWIIDRKAVREQ